MRKLIWLLPLLVAASLSAEPKRIPAFSQLKVAAMTQYRADAARTGLTAQTGPVFLETQRWQRPLSGPVRGLVYDRGVVYADTPGAVYAIDATTGADLWVFAQPGVTFSPVAVADDVVYVSGGNTFYALNRASGALLWSLNVGANIENTSPALVDGVAYVGSTAGTVHAIDLATHAQLWSVNVGSPVRSSLAVSKNEVIVVSDDAIRALKTNNGGEKWSRVGQWGAAAVSDKLVYSGLQGGGFYALNLDNGKTEWLFTDPEHPAGAWTAPVVSNGVVSAGNANTYLYFIDAATGERELFLDALSLPPSEAIGGTGGFIYFGEGNDPNAALSPTLVHVYEITQQLEYSSRFVYGHVTGGVAIGDGAFFVHDSSGTLSAFSD